MDALAEMGPGTMKDVLGFDMPFIFHAKEIGCLCRLQRLVRIVDTTAEYRVLDICSLEKLLDVFCIVNDPDVCGRESEFEDRQRYIARSPRLVGWLTLKMLSLALC